MDYRGFRLVAMPVFPKGRLIYGSDDAGRTVVNTERQFSNWMASAAKRYHLAEHNCLNVSLHTGGDVEGRQVERNGKDSHCM